MLSFFSKKSRAWKKMKVEIQIIRHTAMSHIMYPKSHFMYPKSHIMCSTPHFFL
eukprot:TRINITY_DN1286_c0_g1_i1.p1 TRINITY_DN1286_c0_g1~~TRINITY_DN1286_c0_g1_i1.p1  ORF type:complete len:54 (+),score=3.52 TRINITY_DN1286_c0_g1_i1:352-513(+)